MGLGMIAVAVFFVISGFVIAEACALFCAGRPGAFLLNRVLRLAPPYLAALVVAAIVEEWLYARGGLQLWDGNLVGSPLQPKVLLAGVLDIVPFFKPAYIGAQDIHFIPFSWSLRVEFAFYLYVAAAMVAAGRLPSLRRPILVGSTIAAYVAFVVYAVSGRGPHQLDAIPFFGFGIAIFALLQRRSLLNGVHVAVTLVGLSVAFPLWDQWHHPIVAYQMPLVLALVALFAALVFSVTPSRQFRVVDRALGDMSYALYLNHFTVILVFTNLAPESGWPSYGVAIALSLLLSWLMVRLVELPMRGVRRRVRGVSLGVDQVERLTSAAGVSPLARPG